MSMQPVQQVWIEDIKKKVSRGLKKILICFKTIQKFKLHLIKSLMKIIKSYILSHKFLRNKPKIG